MPPTKTKTGFQKLFRWITFKLPRTSKCSTGLNLEARRRFIKELSPGC